MSNHKIFQSQKYLIIKNVIPKNFCEIFVNYAKFQSLYDFTPELGQDAQISGTHSRYADFLTEALLLQLQPIIEKNINAPLLPTYSYYRVYKKGDCLEPHVDRNECEISVTLAFGWPGCPPWPFKLANDKVYRNEEPDCQLTSNISGISVSLKPGDALIYAGPEVKHWRDPLDSAAWVQAFFHYVRADGDYTDFKFDRRDAIGVPRISSLFEYVQYSDWMQALMSYLSLVKKA